MNKRIENRLGMYRTVISFCDKVTTEMQSIPALWTNYQSFKDKVAELDGLIQLQMKNITGITLDKNNSRERLIDFVKRIGGMIKMYAADTGEFDLYHAAHYTPSSLRNMRDDEAYEAASIVYGLADANSAHLTPYGFTAALFSDFGDAVEDYKNRVSSPEEALKMRKVYTKSITDMDKLIRQMLAQSIDNGMVVLAGTHPVIAAKYKSSRKIYNNSGRRKESIELSVASNGVVMGIVTDGDGLPVEDAIVRIEDTTLNTYTDADGEYMIEVPSGTYNVVVWKDGFMEARDNDVDIGGGENVEVDFVLIASGSAAA